MPNLTIVAHVIAKPDQIDFVHAELTKLIAPTRTEPGCVRYELHRDNENPAHFMFFETWQNRELWQVHMNTPHLLAYMEMAEHAVEEATIYEMTDVS